MTRTVNPTPTLIDLGATPNNGQGSTLRTGGDIINNNFTDLYTAVNSIVDYSLPTATTAILGGVKIDNSTITISNGVISANVSGLIVSPATTIPLIDGTAAVGLSLKYAREDHVHPASTTIPSGVIVMWSGLITGIPSGWYLCDGNNNTPDLRNKFIIGAGSTYAERATGGSANAIVVSHTHTLSAATFSGSALPSHTHGITDPGHTHTYGNDNNNNNGTGHGLGGNGVNPSTTNTSSSTTGISVNSASAGIPSGSIGGSTDTTGSSGTGANLPPYLALAYIMKG